jgi:hypothetical protein
MQFDYCNIYSTCLACSSSVLNLCLELTWMFEMTCPFLFVWFRLHLCCYKWFRLLSQCIAFMSMIMYGYVWCLCMIMYDHVVRYMVTCLWLVVFILHGCECTLDVLDVTWKKGPMQVNSIHCWKRTPCAHKIMNIRRVATHGYEGCWSSYIIITKVYAQRVFVFMYKVYAQ